MVGKIKCWAEARNDLMHYLANLPNDDENVKAVAERGKQILNVIKNKSTRVINHFQKMSEE